MLLVPQFTLPPKRWDNFLHMGKRHTVHPFPLLKKKMLFIPVRRWSCLLLLCACAFCLVTISWSWNESPFCSSENQYVKIRPFEQRRQESQGCCPSALPNRRGRILFPKSQSSTRQGTYLFHQKKCRFYLVWGFYWIYLSDWSGKSNWRSITSTNEAIAES